MDDLYADERVSLSQLQEQYQLRHGVGVAFLKREVGPGDHYDNGVARAVVSPNGAWFECIDLPMEFTGLAGGPVPYSFLSDSGVIELVASLHALCHRASAEDTRLISLFVLYSRRGILDGKGLYAYHLTHSASDTTSIPVEIGRYEPEALPLAARCRLDTDLEAPVSTGALFCLTGIGERNLFVTLPYEGDSVRDLAIPPINTAPQ